MRVYDKERGRERGRIAIPNERECVHTRREWRKIKNREKDMKEKLLWRDNLVVLWRKRGRGINYHLKKMFTGRVISYDLLYSRVV